MSYGWDTATGRTSCSCRDPAAHAWPAVRPYANYPGGHNEGFPDTFKQLVRAVYDTIDRGAAVAFPTVADGHRRNCCCARRSCRSQLEERRWVEMEM